MKYKRTIISQEVVDVATGELIRINQINIIKKDYDLYMKMYLAHVSKLSKLNNAETCLLLYLMNRVKFNTSEITIKGTTIETFSEEAEISLSTANRAVKGLRDKMFIITTNKGIEYLNPVYVWNGHEEKRLKEIEFIKEVFENDVNK